MWRTKVLAAASGFIAFAFVFGFYDSHPVEDLPNLILLLVASLLFFATPLVVVGRFISRRHTSSVMLAGFFAGILFTLGMWADLNFRPSSHFLATWDLSLVTGIIAGLAGFCVTLALCIRIPLSRK